MQIIVWPLFCVLMPLIGVSLSIRMLLHFLLPRRREAVSYGCKPVAGRDNNKGFLGDRKLRE